MRHHSSIHVKAIDCRQTMWRPKNLDKAKWRSKGSEGPWLNSKSGVLRYEDRTAETWSPKGWERGCEFGPKADSSPHRLGDLGSPRPHWGSLQPRILVLLRLLLACLQQEWPITFLLYFFCADPLGPPGGRGPGSLNRMNPRFLRHWQGRLLHTNSLTGLLNRTAYSTSYLQIIKQLAEIHQYQSRLMTNNSSETSIAKVSLKYTPQVRKKDNTFFSISSPNI